MTTIATHSPGGQLTIIAETRHVDIDDACAICGGAGEVEDMEGFWTDCPCVADLPSYDAIMDAALDERFGLPAWEDARDAAREAMPAVVGDVPW